MSKVNNGYQRATNVTVRNGGSTNVYSLLDEFNLPNAVKYGYLYNWPATQDQGGGVSIIPAAMASVGWSVPTDANLTTLADFLGGASIAGGKLKETGTTYWDSPNTGATNEINFNSRGAGTRSTTALYDFEAILIQITIWSSTSFNADNAIRRIIRYNDANYERQTGSPKKQALSIRPVRLATPSELLLSDGTACFPYTGNDGKVYRTVKIGTQVWLADNLAETKFSDGSWIKGYDGVFTDWFLPSIDELEAMHDNLHAFGVGDFELTDIYESSSEESATQYTGYNFNTSIVVNSVGKDEEHRVRAIRLFTLTQSTASYSLRDSGPANGWIFTIVDNEDGTFTYYEAAESDFIGLIVWSNIDNVEIGTTGTAIGTGKANTAAIIAQAGHTASAAKQCDDLTITATGGVYSPISNAAWAAKTEAALCAYDDDETNVLGIAVDLITESGLAELSLNQFENRVQYFKQYVNSEEGFDAFAYETNSERVQNSFSCPLPPDIILTYSILWTDGTTGVEDGLGGDVKIYNSSDVLKDTQTIVDYSKSVNDLLTGSGGGSFKLYLGDVLAYLSGLGQIKYLRWRKVGDVTWSETLETDLYSENTSIEVEVQTTAF